MTYVTIAKTKTSNLSVILIGIYNFRLSKKVRK